MRADPMLGSSSSCHQNQVNAEQNDDPSRWRRPDHYPETLSLSEQIKKKKPVTSLPEQTTKKESTSSSLVLPLGHYLPDLAYLDNK